MTTLSGSSNLMFDVCQDTNLYYITSTLNVVMPEKIKFEVFLEEYQDVSQLPEDSQTLIEQARKYCSHAYAPYSNFLVSAAVLLENGTRVYGTNQENASFPNGLCAERVALSASSSNFPDVIIEKIAVTARKKEKTAFQAITPCGGCLQVMSEIQTRQNKSIEIVMEGGGGKIRVAPNVDMLLPFKFTADYLETE